MNDVDLPQMTSSRTSWLETATVSAAAVAGLVWLGPSPYLALAPLLAGARYGAHHGIGSALCLIVASIAVSSAIAVPADAGAGIASLAWLMAGAISGAFHDASARRLRGLEARSHLLHARLEDLGRAYHVLRASHEKLQKQLPGQPSSLREALERLRESVIDAPCRAPDALAQRVFELLRDHVGVRAATWHAVDESRRARQAIAALGVADGAQEDALIRNAARLREVTSVRDMDGCERGSTLVAVPLVDVEGTVHAVVAIRELPFVALHEDTLSLLAVLGGHIGDLLAFGRTAPIEGSAAPQKSFCVAVSRAIADARLYGVPSALLVLSLRPQALFPPHTREALRRIARKLAASRRSTDLSDVLIDAHGRPRVFLLLRLTDEAELARCQQALETLARDEVIAEGIRCEVDAVCWCLNQAPLPRRPAAVEAFLMTVASNGPSAPALAPAQVSHTKNIVLGRGHGQAA